MKKLLHVIDSLGVGGAENLLVNVINSLDDYEQHLVILNEPVDLKKKIISECKFTNLGIRSNFQLLKNVPRLKKYIRDNNIDIVHSHLYLSNLIARWSVPSNIPLLNSIHAISSLASYKVNRLSLFLERFSYKKDHTIISVSKAVLDDFQQWIGLKGKSHVLYNFIDERYFSINGRIGQPSKKTLNLVAVGNLRWQKNYEYLLESFKSMPDGVQLDIYGEGELRSKFEKIISENKLNVSLKGLRPDLEQVLPNYDAFVMSSFYEGQPLSLLEAAALKLPAILADIPVLREVLEQDALYFDIRDQGSFNKVVQSVLSGDLDLRSMADRAYTRVDAFAHKRQYIEKLKKIYEQSIAA